MLLTNTSRDLQVQQALLPLKVGLKGEEEVANSITMNDLSMFGFILSNIELL